MHLLGTLVARITVQCTVVGASNRKGEINYFVPYGGLK